MRTAARALASCLAVGHSFVAPCATQALAHTPPTGEIPDADEPTREADALTDPDDEAMPPEPDQTAVTADEPREEPPPPSDGPEPEAQRERLDASGGAPVGGRARDADDADELPPGVPARMRPMQAAAWWTLFSAFAVGTTAGVFAGLATRQEDRALRMATMFEIDAGRLPLYEEKRDDYEAILRRGRAYQNTAIALATVAGAATIASIVLFVVDERRTRRRNTALRVHPGGIEVRF